MDPITIIGTLLGGILTGGLFKAKPYCLWVRINNKLENRNPQGNSARRCKKARKVLLDSGVAQRDIMILPKGVIPI